MGPSPWKPPLETIKFRFGTRPITAVGGPITPIHDKVLRLELQPSKLERTILKLIAVLPHFIQTWLQKWIPEWFLTPQIVLKTQKDGWEDEFDLELKTYIRLKSVQGNAIPVHYGLAKRNSIRSHVLSDIGGHVLFSNEAAGVAEADLQQMLENALHPLAALGVAYGDVKLDNFHLVDRDKVVIVDLEKLTSPDNMDNDLTETEWIEYFFKCAGWSVEEMLRDYKSCQDYIHKRWWDNHPQAAQSIVGLSHASKTVP